MGFENSCQRILNLDRRAAWQQRVERQSEIQISIHTGLIMPKALGVKRFFHFFTEKGASRLLVTAPDRAHGAP